MMGSAQSARLLRRLSIGLVLVTVCIAVISVAWAAHGALSARLGRQGVRPSTQIYDRHGQLLYEVVDPLAGRHTPRPLAEMPLALQKATIATEDASFYLNSGVDLRAILRALWINVRGGEVLSGGSTITQQLARNLLLSQEERRQRTLERKLKESVLAWSLARRYSRGEILELYLNTTYYGNYAYGVEAAAQAYFGKSVGALDLAESALIAGLPQAPSAYNPLSDPQAARVRQRVVLDLMVKAGSITSGEADLAMAEDLHFASSPIPIRAPHFVMYVRHLLEREVGTARLNAGGLQVYTTLDLDWQEAAQSIVRHHLIRLTDRPEGPDPHISDAALVAMDPFTGEILAMLGSPDYFDPKINGAVNVSLMPRQPGSALKPLTYAAAFDPTRVHPYTPATMIVDERTAFMTREGEPYVPVNYDYMYHGPVLARRALACSYNLPAVKVLNAVGVDQLGVLARDLGISTFTDMDRFGLALTLGGGEVRLLELTAAYAAFANGGRRVAPVAIARVEDAQGRVLYNRRANPGQLILDPRVAYLITHILSDELARAPAFGEGSALRLSRPAAAKTGTTTDWRDNWTIGYTPGLVAGVWAGNADNTPMEQVSGVTGAAPVWHDFMERVLVGRPMREFREPEGLTRVKVCVRSGQRLNPYCPYQREELFISGTEPTQLCDVHEPLRAETAGAEEPHVVSRRDSPNRKGVAGKVAVSDGTARLARRGSSPTGLALVSPDPNSVFRLDPDRPVQSQRIAIVAQSDAREDLQSVSLNVDGRSIAVLTSPPYRALWTMESGEHVITATGQDTDNRMVSSEPVRIAIE